MDIHPIILQCLKEGNMLYDHAFLTCVFLYIFYLRYFPLWKCTEMEAYCFCVYVFLHATNLNFCNKFWMTWEWTLSFISLDAGPRSAVSNMSGYRCVSDCRSRGREFDPGPVPYFRGDWSWNNFYGHSPPFRWFIQEGLLSVTSESIARITG